MLLGDPTEPGTLWVSVGEKGWMAKVSRHHVSSAASPSAFAASAAQAARRRTKVGHGARLAVQRSSPTDTQRVLGSVGSSLHSTVMLPNAKFSVCRGLISQTRAPCKWPRIRIDRTVANRYCPPPQDCRSSKRKRQQHGENVHRKKAGNCRHCRGGRYGLYGLPGRLVKLAILHDGARVPGQRTTGCRPADPRQRDDLARLAGYCAGPPRGPLLAGRGGQKHAGRLQGSPSR